MGKQRTGRPGTRKKKIWFERYPGFQNRDAPALRFGSMNPTSRVWGHERTRKADVVEATTTLGLGAGFCFWGHHIVGGEQGRREARLLWGMAKGKSYNPGGVFFIFLTAGMEFTSI